MQIPLFPALALSLLCLTACSQPAVRSTPQRADIVATSEFLLPNNVPEFAHLGEAIDYATQEKNLVGFEGLIFGSEHFYVDLPSGGTISNWKVNSFYRAVFAPFGEAAFPFLAPLLDHEHVSVQVGAYSVLNATMYKHGLGRHTRDTREERVATMHALQEILKTKHAPE